LGTAGDTGAQLPQLLGVGEDSLEVLAIRHSTCVPIPFQVDERRADGRYVMPDGAVSDNSRPAASTTRHRRIGLDSRRYGFVNA
jgi:hypothetical protein